MVMRMARIAGCQFIAALAVAKLDPVQKPQLFQHLQASIYRRQADVGRIRL